MKTLRDFIGDLLMLAGVALVFSGGLPSLHWPVIGAKAPFMTDKLSVLVVEETEQRTTQIDSIIGAVQTATVAAGGNFRRLDKDQTDLSKDEPWVQAAWAVKGSPPPWIVAADKRTGVNQAMPQTSAADAIKLLSPLGVK